MKRRKNNRIILKREAIKSDSLIVGIDIGSRFHSVVFQNKRGEMLRGIEKVYNNRKGFDYLDKEIEGGLKRYNLNGVHIGFEPTGYYWKTIIYHLAERGYEIHFVRTTAVKSQRELDDSSSSKTDLEDANDIASIIREGKYIDARIQRGVYRNLRDLGKLRAKVMGMKTSMVNRLHMLVNMYFPELIEIFWSIDSVGIWNVLKLCPFPGDVEGVSRYKLKRALTQPGVRKERVKEQMDMIKQASKKTIGIEASESDRLNLENCIETLEHYHKQLLKIKKEMQRLLEQTEYWEYMKTISGFGIITAGTLLGELGDLKNFKSAKSIIKFAGIDPKEDSSGLTRHKNKLSKKGRYLLRTMLYYISMRLIYRSNNFRAYYKKKLEIKNIYGKNLFKKEALFAVAIKFIKVLFAMIRDKTKYREAYKTELKLAA